jgi:hypothetical protein
VGAEEGESERRRAWAACWPWVAAPHWANSGCARGKKKEREGNWVMASAGPLALLDQAEREKEVKEVFPFSIFRNVIKYRML